MVVADTVPETLLQRIRAYRRGRQFSKAGVTMVHVPRSAGTSLAASIYGTFLGHFTLQDLLSVSPARILALPRFTVVRNPWSRAVSAWSFARAGGGLEPAGELRVRIAHPERYQGSEFASFERFVNDWLARQRLERLDGVFRLQTDYILDRDGKLALDHVGRFEQLPETIAWLSDRLGRKLVPPHANRSEVADYRSYYTPSLRDRVAAIYARDIELLGYDF
jgi:chondroitin 4-sulfotransferase 11